MPYCPSHLWVKGIAKIHHDRDKDLILRLSREKFPLEYKGKQLNIFPDYTPEVTAQRSDHECPTGSWSEMVRSKSPEDAKMFVDNLPNTST
ncbi:hypothetical protein QQF64_020104 [Cirrhinus molitorella]|uniref:Uncharacterized protein n=1 Tax=Cirrhinus molitorella TaxID=172907 RepID=A0ABR3LHL4_9TELE